MKQSPGEFTGMLRYDFLLPRRQLNYLVMFLARAVLRK
jgi:hypothetical protein